MSRSEKNFWLVFSRLDKFQLPRNWIWFTAEKMFWAQRVCRSQISHWTKRFIPSNSSSIQTHLLNQTEVWSQLWCLPENLSTLIVPPASSCQACWCTFVSESASPSLFVVNLKAISVTQNMFELIRHFHFLCLRESRSNAYLKTQLVASFPAGASLLLNAPMGIPVLQIITDLIFVFTCCATDHYVPGGSGKTCGPPPESGSSRND